MHIIDIEFSFWYKKFGIRRLYLRTVTAENRLVLILYAREHFQVLDSRRNFDIFEWVAEWREFSVTARHCQELQKQVRKMAEMQSSMVKISFRRFKSWKEDWNMKKIGKELTEVTEGWISGMLAHTRVIQRDGG